MGESLRIREGNGAVEIALHVQPRARRTEICGTYNGALKVRIAAPPVDDAANRAIIQFFAELLSIPRSRLRIVAGERSREKTLRIDGWSLETLLPYILE